MVDGDDKDDEGSLFERRIAIWSLPNFYKVVVIYRIKFAARITGGSFNADSSCGHL